MKPIALICNDIHLQESNIELIQDLFDQMFALCRDNEIYEIYILGDVFHSRVAQRLSVLNTFREIIDKAVNEGVQIYTIPGNHDKTRYDSPRSFLDIYSGKRFENISEVKTIVSDEVACHFLPFFSEAQYLERLKEIDVEPGITNILLTHIAVEGSVNNDGSEVESNIKLSDFSKFDKVLSGHYHNEHAVGKNFFHLPSVCQNNYGEDEKKGVTVLLDNGDHEFYQLNFPRYRKVVVDVDKSSKEEIKKEIESNKDIPNLRLEFKGSEGKLKAIDANEYTSKGIDVKKKNTSISYEKEDKVLVEKLTNEKLNDLFKEFCQENCLEYSEGVQYMN